MIGQRKYESLLDQKLHLEKCLAEMLQAHSESVAACYAERDEADRRAGAAMRRLQRYKKKVRDQGEAIAAIAPWLSASLSEKPYGLGEDVGAEYRAACDLIFELDPTMKWSKPSEPS